MIDRLTKDRFKIRTLVCILGRGPCYDDCRKCPRAIEKMKSKKRGKSEEIKDRF